MQSLGYQNPFYLEKAQRIKPTLYDGSVISSQHAASPVIDDEETLILEEVSRSKMLAKQNDPISKEKKVNTTPINYVELNKLSEDFGKRFVPQQELSAEQAFWLQTSNPNNEESDISPGRIEAPSELPKEQSDILREIVEQAKAKQPIDNALDFACKHAKRIHELLVYVRDTCPNAYKPSEKLIVVTPMNKFKKVRFSESLISSSNIQQGQAEGVRVWLVTTVIGSSESQSESTQTVSALKLPMLKTGDYDLWSMRMEQYLTHTDYALWEVIMNGDASTTVASPSAGTEGLDKIYDRFQKLISQLEIQGEVISQEDANLKLLKNNTSNTNEAVNTTHDVSAASSQGQASSSTYADDVIFSFFANQYNSPQLDNEDLEQIDTDDLEEMDLKWQVAMLTMMMKRFIKKTRRNLNLNGKETVGFDMTKGNRNRDKTRRVVPVETPANALVVTDRMGYDWSYQAEEGPTDFALMAHLSSGSSSSSSSNTEVRDISIKDLKIQLEEALKEKDDLKSKLENQMNENKLHDSHQNKGKVFESASDSSMNECEEDNDQVNDRYKAGVGYHTVPPPYTGNYMPPIPDLYFAGLDEYVFWSVVRKSTTTVPKTKTILTKSGNVLVNNVKQSSSRTAVSNSTAKYVNTATSRPTMNDAKPCSNVFHKSHSSVKRTIYQRTTPKNSDFKEKINTAKVNNVTTAGTKAVVSVVQGHEENAVKSSAC
ncbi:hypothetical protein Tco_0111731 [Tanacetum coccineum]